ncbi:hypothetical protein NS206_06780 [Microbacterium testaceum]|nr:hypothetical protein NS206_06780 [Microbacterium testaceum]KTS84848.1 hypothetical protein NS183_13760 [Microbacterium testaceum]
MLLEGDLAGAADLSVRISEAVSLLASSLELEMAAEVVFAAGDEVLARTSLPIIAEDIERLREQFRTRSGLTISCGVAESAGEATRHLHLAKLRGKNRTEVVTIG